MIGVRRAPCPSCGSVACAVQAPKGCRHTRQPRTPATSGPPAKDTTPGPAKTPRARDLTASNKGR